MNRPVFLDYDYLVRRDGSEIYLLRGHPLPGFGTRFASYCKIYKGEQPEYGQARWTRKTCNGTKPSIRYVSYATLDEALAAGIKWGRRKIAEERRSDPSPTGA